MDERDSEVFHHYMNDILQELRRIGDLLAAGGTKINFPAPVDADSFCKTCGLALAQTMGYVCQRTDCPTGLGGPKTNG